MHPPFPSRFSAPILAGALSPSLHWPSRRPPTASASLPPVAVTGLHSERDPADLPAVIDGPGPEALDPAGVKDIRGLEGKRVLLTVGGVRVPRAENPRGAGSALYGSDGQAGRVAMLAPEPLDRGKPGLSTLTRLRLKCDTEDNGRRAGLRVARRRGHGVNLVRSQLDNRLTGCQSMTNPDLKPEKSRTQGQDARTGRPLDPVNPAELRAELAQRLGA